MTHHTGYHTVVNSEFAVTDERVPVRYWYPASSPSREKEGRKERKKEAIRKAHKLTEKRIGQHNLAQSWGMYHTNTAPALSTLLCPVKYSIILAGSP